MIPRVGVCVLHITPFFLRVDTPNKEPVSVRVLHPREMLYRLLDGIPSLFLPEVLKRIVYHWLWVSEWYGIPDTFYIPGKS